MKTDRKPVRAVKTPQAGKKKSPAWLYAMQLDLRVALLYAFFGGVWILVTDNLLSEQVSGSAVLTRLQTWKGWLFVTVSALLIFGLLRRELKLRAASKQESLESEQRFRLLFEHSLDAILLTTPDGRIHAANPAACQLFGRTETEIQRLGRNGIVDMADPRLKSALEERARTGKFHGELTFLRPNGTKFEGDITSNIFKTNDGVERSSMIIRDITERKRAEDELERFFNVIPDMACIASTDGYFKKLNSEWGRVLGFSQEELLARPLADFIHPEDRDVTFYEMERQVKGNATIRFVNRYQAKDGSYRWLEWNAIPSPDGILLFAAARDITDRKQAEDALRESERQMRALVTSLDDIVFEFDGQGTYLNVWTANDKLLNQPKDQILGRRIVDVLGEEPGRPFEDAVKRVLQSGIPESIEYPLEVIGGHRWFVARLSPIITGEMTYHSVSMLVRDITQRKQAEEAIRQGEDRYRQTLDNMLEGCQIIDFDWRYTYVNETAARQGHATRDELVQHTMMEKYPGIENTGLFSVLRDCMENRAARQMENEFTYPDGSRGWFELSIQPVPAGIFVLSMDITERKRAETQVQIQMQRLRALNEIDRAISSSMDLRVSLDILLNQVLSQLGVDAASVLLLNTSNLMLEFAAGKGYRTPAIRQTRMRLGEGYAGQVGLERRVIHVPNLSLVGKQYQRAALLKNEEFKQYFGVPLVAKGQLKGVLEVFQRSPLQPDAEWLHYLETLGGQAAIAMENAQMFEGLHQSNLELVTAYDATIAGWSHAMDLRDKETEGHTQRVTELTIQLAERMGLGAQQIVHIRRGALLHDIGKLGVPDPILLKPGALTEEEWVIMRQHPTYAYEMLLPITYLHPALDIPHYHHEKWDGSGYPHGLTGEQIPLAARLFAVVDVWDALRSDRPYRKSWSADQTRAYLLEQSGKHFEPRVVDAFLRLIEKE